MVAVLAGLPSVPGTTITRFCSSSLQSTRMAFHAIRAGEGDVFVSAGVESASRLDRGASDHRPIIVELSAATVPATAPGLTAASTAIPAAPAAAAGGGTH